MAMFKPRPNITVGGLRKTALVSSETWGPRVEDWSKNNVRLAVISGEKKVFSPQSARIF